MLIIPELTFVATFTTYLVVVGGFIYELIQMDISVRYEEVIEITDYEVKNG